MEFERSGGGRKRECAETETRPMHDGGLIGVLDPMGVRDDGGVGGYASAGRDQGKLDVGAAGATVEDGGLVASGGVGVGGPGEGIVGA